MALEALTKAKIRQVCSASGFKSESELANHLGVEVKNLDSTVRKRLLLADDDECYKKAKDASDGLEHGFLGYDKIRKYAKRCEAQGGWPCQGSYPRFGWGPEIVS
jgi:hypothetical protein